MTSSKKMQHIDHTKNIIELRGISFSYGDDKVLRDITLDIHEGDYLGLIGPNGGGKSTLLKIMLGFLAPEAGEVKLFGSDISRFNGWSKIGYVSQRVSFDANFPLTAKEVASMGRYAKRGLFRFLTSHDEEIVDMALRQVDMYEYRNRLIGDLSGGQQQRVFIARALAGEPEVIVLDEPTVGVDQKTQEQFYALLRKLNKDLALTLILVSHELGIVASEATELACLNRELVYYGQPKKFFEGGGYLSKLYGKGAKLTTHPTLDTR
ncbi:MAG: metal ABC transporter ATP-binding protein [Candidatus Liptonbacteria bacterium]|nr:metal ABC transporter ATP-binding protein [Candidatus Liptonbacteria bacterium]